MNQKSSVVQILKSDPRVLTSDTTSGRLEKQRLSLRDARTGKLRDNPAFCRCGVCWRSNCSHSRHRTLCDAVQFPRPAIQSRKRWWKLNCPFVAPCLSSKGADKADPRRFATNGCSPRAASAAKNSKREADYRQGCKTIGEILLKRTFDMRFSRVFHS